jgi:hypothetical protein
MSKVLLANVCSHLAARHEDGACGLPRTTPGTDTHVVAMRNYVIIGWGII